MTCEALAERSWSIVNTTSASHTIANPVQRSAVIPSCRMSTPNSSCMTGVRYCVRPSSTSGSRRAAPANSSDAGSLFALALMDNYDAEAKAALYAGGAWTRDQAVELAGHTANVTLATSSLAGAALDHAGTFYVAARSAWAIFEYAWDLDDPFVLTYVRDIMIDDPCLYSWDGCE